MDLIPPLSKEKWIKYLVIIFFIGLSIRLIIVSRDISIIDRFFIPDDTYYTLTIAKNIAEGKGPTVDGIVLTNGFQPLLAFILFPFAKIISDPDVLLRINLFILAVVDSINIILIALLVKRITDNVYSGISLLAAIFWSLSSVAISNALGGLETSLSLFFVLLLLELWHLSTKKRQTFVYILTGIVAALALLARIDSSFVIGVLGFYELLISKNRKKLYIISLSAFIAILPWWVYQLFHFQTVVPESGSAVHLQASFHKQAYLVFTQQIAWALGTLIDFLTGDVIHFRSTLFSHHSAGAILYTIFSVVSIIYLFKKIHNDSTISDIYCFIIAAILLSWFYIIYVPALWFFMRYLVVTQVAALFLIVIFLKYLLSREIVKLEGIKKTFSIFYGVLLIANIIQNINYIIYTPTQSELYGLLGAKGYRDAAFRILELTPANSIIGAFQSGALGYYAPFTNKNIRVVNLDGVVNNEAAKALEMRKIDCYANQRQLTHFADWKFNVMMFVNCSSNPSEFIKRLNYIASAEAQSPDYVTIKDKFELYSISW